MYTFSNDGRSVDLVST